MKNLPLSSKEFSSTKRKNPNRAASPSPLALLVRKEVYLYMRSWRFLVLLIVVALTFAASMYISASNLKSVVTNHQNPDHIYMYLKLLTATDNSIAPFHVFLGFLAPLLGISLGFDAINSESNAGTLSRLMAQPIYRDTLLIAKVLAPLLIVSTLFTALVLLMIGGGLLYTGVTIEMQEVVRILLFVFISVCYVAFWANFAVLCSIRFKQAATSALVAIGVWLFFTIFYPVLVNLLVHSFLPSPNMLTPEDYVYYNELIMALMRLSPSQLYSDATTTLLMPSIRSLGPVSMEKMMGAIPAPLQIRDSILLVWPQISGLLASTMLCFALAYALFMRREIRA